MNYIEFYSNNTLKSTDECALYLYQKIKKEELLKFIFKYSFTDNHIKYTVIKCMYYFMIIRHRKNDDKKNDDKKNDDEKDLEDTIQITDSINYGEGVVVSKNVYKGNLYNMNKKLIANGEITYRKGEFSCIGTSYLLSTHSENHKFSGSFVVNALTVTYVKGTAYYFIYPNTVLTCMNSAYLKADIFRFSIEEFGEISEIYYNNILIVDRDNFHLNIDSHIKKQKIINFPLTYSNIRTFINLIYPDLKTHSVM